MKITLLLEGARHRVELTEEGVTVGRGDAATIRVASNAVSRVHARFFLKNGKSHVVDLKSLNGTTVNGTMINGPTPFQAGDAIQLGEISVQWVQEMPVKPLSTTSSGGIHAL